MHSSFFHSGGKTDVLLLHSFPLQPHTLPYSHSFLDASNLEPACSTAFRAGEADSGLAYDM